MASDASESGVVDLRILQVQRCATLKHFAAYLSYPPVQSRVISEPELFAQIIELAVNEYGVRQIALAAELGISSAAVSRWMASQSLPVPYGRPHILQALAKIINDNLVTQDRLIETGQEKVAKGTVSAVLRTETA